MMHIVTLGTGDEKIVSGKTLEDTYTLMLASLKGITEAAAKGVVREYPTVRELYEGWAACRSEREKKEMLADVMVSRINTSSSAELTLSAEQKGHLTTGARTDRTIGKAASEFIYKVFNHRECFLARPAALADELCAQATPTSSSELTPLACCSACCLPDIQRVARMPSTRSAAVPARAPAQRKPPLLLP